MTLLGIDVGGTGSRIGISCDDGPGRRSLDGPPVQIGAGGSTVPAVVLAAVRMAREAWPEEMGQVRAVGIGATGLASLVEDPSALVPAVADNLRAPAVAATDAVTAHLGALGGRGGAVVALGTGAVAVGHPGIGPGGIAAGTWRQVDGWGHLLGDRGGGAWIGRQGLELALRAYDGVGTDDGSGISPGQALLEAGRRRFGDPETWPRQLYTRADRAGIMASFAREVVELALAGDPAAFRLLESAGHEAAWSALAALDGTAAHDVALTGGLARAESPLTRVFTATLREARPEVAIRQPAGDPLDGALRLAALRASGRVAGQPGYVWL